MCAYSILFNNRYRGFSYQISFYGFRDFDGRIASFPCNRNHKVSLFSRLVWKLHETYTCKRNRKLEDKIHALKMYLDVKVNGGKFQFCISRFLFIFHHKWSSSDGRCSSIVALWWQTTVDCVHERLITMKRGQGVITTTKHETEWAISRSLTDGSEKLHENNTAIKTLSRKA